MLKNILKLMTRRKTKQTCSYCKKEFIGDSYKTYHRGLGIINVSLGYCSKNHEKLMHAAIRKCENGKKLTRQDKLAVKNLRYIDV
jgi:hypothetical protein